MATGAADGFLHSCASLSGFDAVVERRPYHKNCGCALHEKKGGGGVGGGCPHSGAGKSRAVSYPIRRSWSEGSLALMATSSQSPSTSPAVAPGLPPKAHMRRLSSSSSILTEFDEE